MKVEQETVPPTSQAPSKPTTMTNKMEQKVVVQEEITDFDELD